MSIRTARIVRTIKPATNGRYGAILVNIALPGKQYELRAYAKPLAEYEIMVELMTALIGIKLKLPIPEPIIAISEDGNDALFASLEITALDLTHQLKMDGETILNTPHNNQLLVTLSKWKSIDRAIGFDEWIANDDRNTGNILYDGTDQFHLIDHNRAMQQNVQPHDITENQLLNIKQFYQSDELSKQRLKNTLSALQAEISQALPKEIATKIIACFPHLNSPSLDNMVSFLEHRLLHLSKLTNSKIKTKQVSL